MHCRRFSSNPGLYPLRMTNKNVSIHCQISSAGQNHRQLKNHCPRLKDLQALPNNAEKQHLKESKCFS